MFRLLKPLAQPHDLLTSTLYSECTFYDMFIRDLKHCQQEVLIESPFVTARRLNILLPTLKELKSRNVRIVINTRNPEEHDDAYVRSETWRIISTLQHLGIQVLYTGDHHRKLAILDRKILYEGSLNILSQNDSCEVMRRIESVQLAKQMAHFIGIDKFL